MELTTDIVLRGTNWNEAIEKLSDIFATRTNYSIFMLSLAIGIMYDQRIIKLDEDGMDPKYVPRNVINNNDNGKLDLFYQAAVLSTLTENFSEDTRLEMAFGDKVDFNKIAFLVSFANFGVTKLCELIGVTVLDTVQNIKAFLHMTIAGENDKVDDLPIDFEDFFD